MNNELVENNINLVYYIISKEYPTFIGDDDVIQSGMLGLCNAANKWDESKAKFSTYAVKCIRHEIQRELISRKPIYNQLSLDYEYETTTFGDTLEGDSDVAYIDNSFYQQLNKDDKRLWDLLSLGCSTEEVAEALGVSRQTIAKRKRNLKTKWRDFNGDQS